MGTWPINTPRSGTLNEAPLNVSDAPSAKVCRDGTAHDTQSARSEAGFTIVEAMMAGVILVFGLVMVIHLFAVAAADFTFARSQSLAVQAAQHKMETLVEQYRMGSALASSTTPDVVTFPNPNDPNNPFSRFQVSWTVSPLSRGAQVLQVMVIPARSDTVTNIKPNLNKVVILRTVVAPTKG